ncbi:hypothetical protein RDWZM_002779 [Blomia tropicalis]|uniref:Insulin-degrading enzyme-like n=1 Tax=Blomia tropicalis TaxID=40697 RepID=A0A9Q0MEB5_BLOTA|nr:hypothetical protein RDWZM_002779 [Blomia tropicalis]
MAQPMVNNTVLRCEDIIKPNNDTRVYRALLLPNQLRVMLVSDPTTDKSAGSLSVRVGSLADPWDCQGMAHFLEHALFLTTRKYPEENFFKNYVVAHGGGTNAFTSLTETCYFFDCGPDALEGALDRFAQFFVEPLFPRDLIERELQSVQFEFENTVTSDGHRFYRVRKVHCDANHEFSKFETGNKNTLIITDKLFADMIQFFQTWYSANIMTLAVFGKESLDQLENMVVPLFSQIVNKQVQPQWIPRHPYPPNVCGNVAKIIPFKESRKLIWFFPLPCFQGDAVKCDALSYITFLLAHEGHGSLLAELKDQGYCTLLDVSTYYYNGFGFLDIDVNLTQGITKNDEIIELFFQYIKMLKAQPPQERIYNEIKLVNEMKFHFRDKFDPQTYVKFLCGNMHIYPFLYAVSGRALFGPFNPQEINNVLNMITLENFNLQVISPIFKQHGLTFRIDPIYGTEYVIERLPETSLNRWRNPPFNPNLTLPCPNEYIPQNFTLKGAQQQQQQQSNQQQPNQQPNDIPSLVFSKDNIKVWHLLDTKYLVPKAFYGFVFKSPLINDSPLNTNLVGLFLKLFYDYINQKFYAADLVGIGYSITTNRIGFEIIVQGFNDKLELFLYAMVNELLNFKASPKRMEIVRDIYYNGLRFLHLFPIPSILHTYLDQLLIPNLWSHDELIASFPYMNDEKLGSLMSNIFSNCRVEMLAHGNVTREEAVAISQRVYQTITQRVAICPVDLYRVMDKCRDVQLICGTTEMSTINEQHENHGFLLFYQIGLLDLAQRARLELLHQIISEPYFNQIRMAEQLAYVTFVTQKFTYSGSVGITILIQSAYSLKYLESRVDAFIESLESILTTMKDEHFQKEKSALITKISTEPKSMFGLSGQLWHQIVSGQYQFDRDRRLVTYLKRVKLSDIITAYRRTLRPDGCQCRRLLVTIHSNKCKEMVGKFPMKPTSKSISLKSASSNKPPSSASSSVSSAQRLQTFSPELANTSPNKHKSSSKSKRQSKSSSQRNVRSPKRIIVKNIRKFKCESILCPIPKIILDKI